MSLCNLYFYYTQKLMVLTVKMLQNKKSCVYTLDGKSINLEICLNEILLHVCLSFEKLFYLLIELMNIEVKLNANICLILNCKVFTTSAENLVKQSFSDNVWQTKTKRIQINSNINFYNHSLLKWAKGTNNRIFHSLHRSSL